MADSRAAEHARSIITTLREAGHAAFLVGGCVRDLVLGREPSDYDVATAATPDQVLALLPGAVLVGAHFGVVLAPSATGESVEVATFRSDHSYRDGRHPSAVSFETDPRQDVLRRDFTINALLLDPQSGEVLDYTGGLRDLRDGIIRAIGDPRKRFEEDHLRMLRAVRFAARFAYRIEDATFAAISALRSRIHRISAERIREELTRMLTEGRPRRAFELLHDTGLLQELLPEIEAMRGVEQPPEYHPEGDVWTHTLLMLDALEHPSPELAWGALLHDSGKPPTFRRAPDRIRFDGHVEAGVRVARGILTRLRFSQEQTDRVEALVANHMRFMDVSRMKDSTLKKFLRLPHFDEHLALHKADCLSSHRDLSSYNFAVETIARMPQEVLRPPRLLSGDDLIALGLAPGPAFRRILDAVEDAQLEGTIATRDEALRLARALREID
ncbi:MAG: CCA tRNA nucleotidyltransferase [Bryobacteraceae bacterium]|nr:CCA tRNA nucleotidyltransferase [Bryobacteraceae bacterium]